MNRHRAGALIIAVASSLATAAPAMAQDNDAPKPAAPVSPSASTPPDAPTTPSDKPSDAKKSDDAKPLPPGPRVAAEDPEPRPTSPGAPLPEPPPREANVDRGCFQFGSYGRVGASTDGRGGTGRDANIATHGSRLDEGTYVELELRREDTWTEPGESPVSTVVVSTLAVADPLFHSSGQFAATIAVRNLYLEERGIFDKNIAIWVGSRMYRGDDAYLLDWWPLDNLNTVGGGIRWQLPTRTEIALHAGVNRLNDPFSYQTSARPLPYNQIGTTDVTILNRAKIIESGRIEQVFPVFGDKGGLKAVLYGELHQMGSGQQETQPGQYQDLPSDGGFVLGTELGAFTGEHDGHLNLFLRYAGGLAAYGELAVPTNLANNKTTQGAHDATFALSGNIESGPATVQLAGYYRSFRTASAGQYNYGSLDEAVLDVRPRVYFTDRAGAFIDASYEVIQHGILDPSGSAPVKGQVYRLGVVPFLSPAGKGSYKRPELRAIWLMTFRDSGAQGLYAADDVFAHRSVEQFIGLQAEWWFNSSYR